MKTIRSTEGEPEGARLGQASGWWSQQAVRWDGQRWVPASHLLPARWLSRGCLRPCRPPRWGWLPGTHLFCLRIAAWDGYRQGWVASTAWRCQAWGPAPFRQRPVVFLAALPKYRVAGERHEVCRLLCFCTSKQSLGVKWGKQ